MPTTQEIAALRRAGRLQEALAAAEEAYSANADKFTAGMLFWCLHDLLRRQIGDEAAATRSRMETLYNDYCPGDGYMANTLGWMVYNELKNKEVSDVNARKVLLNKYLKLDAERPSNLHSAILGEAVKVEKNTPLQFRIRDFVRLWGLGNLRPEDWEQFRADNGHMASSLVEKLISVYAKELKTDGVDAPEEFVALLDEALAKFPNNQYLPLYKAYMLMAKGNATAALDYYKEMILKSPSKVFLWAQASELVEDLDMKIALLCKALSYGRDEQFLVKIRLKLASLLMQKGLSSNARFELEKYRETHLANRWGLKQEFWKLYNQVSGAELPQSNDALYAEYAVKSDGVIYSALPAALAVKVADKLVDDRNRPGKKIPVWTLRAGTDTLWLRKPVKFGLDRRTPDGTVFDIRLHDGKIVWIKPHEGAIETSWMKEMTGEVHLRTGRTGKPYAIISGAYVGDRLLRGVTEGRQVRIRAIRQDGDSWQAISLQEL